jgi:hypothetical protein
VTTGRATSAARVAERVDRLDWDAIAAELDAVGHAPTGPVLTERECAELGSMYGQDDRFRSTIDMARYRYGEGQYRYFCSPLPDVVQALRSALWPHVLPVAREWAARLRRPAPWPDDLEQWLAQCHTAGQTRPTPLLLHYEAGHWNALHRDLYGELVFPLQVVIGLDAPGADYTGGEFVMVEQRARAQSRPSVTTIERGQAVVFTTRDRPVRSARGWSTAAMRHGVSTVRSGRRRTLGIPFHDAR